MREHTAIRRLAAFIASSALAILWLAPSAAAHAQGFALPESLDPAVVLRKMIEKRLGRAIRYEGVAFELSPPRLLFTSFEVAGEKPDDPPAAQVFEATVPIDPVALLQGVLSIDMMRAKRAHLRLRPDLPLDFEGVTLKARATSPDAPLGFDLEGQVVGERGALRFVGISSLEGVLDAKLELDSVDASLGAVLLPSFKKLVGRITGVVDIAGPAERLTKVDPNVELRDAQIHVRELRLRKQVRLEGEFAELFRTRSDGSPAPFRIDAGGAAMKYAGAYEKKPGTPARVVGTVGRDDEGQLVIAEMQLLVGERAAAPP